MSLQVDRFMKVRKQSFLPRNKARVLYGIAFSLDREELVELRKQVGARLVHFRELDAPAILISNQDALDKVVYNLIDEVEAQLAVKVK